MHEIRSRRRRCHVAENGNGGCALCQKQNLPCVSASQSTPAATAGPVTPPTDPAPASSTNTVSRQTAPLSRQPSSQDLPAAVKLPPSMVCFHLATLYFEYIHDQLHSLFHRPTFMADMMAGKVSSVIMFAIIALSARFSSHAFFNGVPPRARGGPYGKKGAELLDLRDVSLTSIQACVLLGANCIIDGDAAGESVYYGIACRMAQILRLSSRSCISRLERETNIRVWHTLCMVDEWSSTGLQVPRQVPHPPSDVPLPMDEMAYLQLRHQDDATMDCPAGHKSSLLTQMVILSRIFADINELNKSAALADVRNPDTYAVKELSARLEAWEAQLPHYMRDDPCNMVHYATLGLGRTYVAVYLGYYHFGQLLNYQFLHQSNDAADGGSVTFAESCKAHAERLCNMVYTALDTPGCDVLYNMVGHILVVASTVQIHTLLFSVRADEIGAARLRLERNFDILLRLRDLWPSLDLSMMRLRAFHKACRASMDTSFKLDSWMLKFLSEFAMPIDDKQAASESYGGLDWSLEDMAITPDAMFNFESIIS